MQLKLRHAPLLATINYRASQLLPMRSCAVPEGKISPLVSDPGTGALIFMHASTRWDAKGAITHIPTDKRVVTTYEKQEQKFLKVTINPQMLLDNHLLRSYQPALQTCCLALTKGELGTHQVYFTCFISALFLTISCTWPPFKQLPVSRSSKIILPSISGVIISLITAHKMG